MGTLSYIFIYIHTSTHLSVIVSFLHLHPYLLARVCPLEQITEYKFWVLSYIFIYIYTSTHLSVIVSFLHLYPYLLARVCPLEEITQYKLWVLSQKIYIYIYIYTLTRLSVIVSFLHLHPYLLVRVCPLEEILRMGTLSYIFIYKYTSTRLSIIVALLHFYPYLLVRVCPLEELTQYRLLVLSHIYLYIYTLPHTLLRGLRGNFWRRLGHRCRGHLRRRRLPAAGIALDGAQAVDQSAPLALPPVDQRVPGRGEKKWCPNGSSPELFFCWERLAGGLSESKVSVTGVEKQIPNLMTFH